MAKKVFYDAEAREKVLGGAKALYDAVKVTGRVENDTDEEKGYLSVYIIFRDANDKVIAIDTTTVMSEIGAGMKGSFDSSTIFGNENLKLENIKDVEVICEETYMQF